jgi:hypothetical protein
MKNASQPINPIKTQNSHGNVTQLAGLTKREHFAAMAMQGILANQKYEAPRRDRLSGMAIDAVAAADWLLAELDKPTGVNDGE